MGNGKLFLEKLETTKEEKLKKSLWGEKYLPLLKTLPPIVTTTKIYHEKVVSLGKKEELNPQEREKLYNIVKSLCPWRKGPFSLFGIEIDSEWQSNLKYERIKLFLQEIGLSGKIIWDIGSGNGYYLFRLVGDGAEKVVGFDPSLLYYAQFSLINHYAQEDKISFFPLGWEELEGLTKMADVILCMGLIYHEENPFLLLRFLHELLKPKGYLILESLTVDFKMPLALFPGKSYANLSGIWHIPSPLALENYLKKCGYSGIKTMSHVPLKEFEQRPTAWAKVKPLSSYLSRDGKKTIEGYPPPYRTVVVAKK